MEHKELKKSLLLVLVFIFLSLVFVKPKAATAGCDVVTQSTYWCSGCSGSSFCNQAGDYCVARQGTVSDPSCPTGCATSYEVSCSNVQIPGSCTCGGGPLGNCPGRCNPCQPDNCTAFGNGPDCRDHTGCTWDGDGCSGSWCRSTDCTNVARDTCSSFGCNWVPQYGSCRAGSTCTGGTCLNECSETTACTVCTPTTCAAQGVTCGSIPDGCGTNLNCGDATCTITASPASMTLMVGEGALLSGNVTITSTCGSTSSTSWSSSSPSVATVGTPGSQTTVTGVATGTTNISATASLSPSGSCSTTTPTAVTVITTFFQTFGGDVTFKGTLSDSYLPSGKYVSAR